MQKTKQILSSLLLGALVITACNNEQGNEDGAEGTNEAVENTTKYIPPAPPSSGPLLVEDDGQGVEVLGEDRSIDDEGNVVDPEGNIIMPAEEAKKNNIVAAHHEKATPEEAKVAEKVFELNNRFMWTAKLGEEKCTKSDWKDMAAGITGEHQRLGDMVRVFGEVTKSKLKLSEDKPNIKLSPASGETWDEAWAKELIHINTLLQKEFQNKSSVAKHPELKHVLEEFPEHLKHENQLLRDMMNDLGQEE